MIDITTAQAGQSTVNGINQDWIVTLDKKEVYKLPAHFSAQETFDVRDIIEKMMTLAVEEEGCICDKKIQEVITHGDAKLGILKEENLRLSSALEQHILLNEVA
jgi:hypothetical protein